MGRNVVSFEEHPESHGCRSIDDFYIRAHDDVTWTGPLGIVRFLANRSTYLMCYLSLGMVNAGSTASLTCMAYLFASNTNYEEITQGQEGTIAMAIFIGALIGGLLGGPLSDSSGRRRILLISLCAMSIFGILTAFANSPWSLFICRFLTGLGIGSAWPCTSALVAEHASSKSRGFYVNFCESMWTVGFIYGALLAWVFLEREGRIWATIFSLGIAAPNVLGLSMVYFYVPESFRFLAIYGKHEEAAKVANRVAESLSFRGLPLEKEEVSHHYPAETFMESPPTTLESIKRSTDAYKELYATPKLRMRVLTAQAMWFLFYVGYGVAQWVSRLFQELDVVENIYLNSLIFAVGAVPGLYMAGMVIERTSRTFFLLGTLFATLGSIGSFTLLSYFSMNAAGIVVVSAMFHSCLMACWAAIAIVTTEGFSTSKRSAVIGVCSASAMLGQAVMNFTSAMILQAEKPILLLFVGTSAIILIVLAACSGNLKVMEKDGVLRDISISLRDISKSKQGGRGRRRGWRSGNGSLNFSEDASQERHHHLRSESIGSTRSNSSNDSEYECQSLSGTLSINKEKASEQDLHKAESCSTGRWSLRSLGSKMRSLESFGGVNQEDSNESNVLANRSTHSKDKKRDRHFGEDLPELCPFEKSIAAMTSNSVETREVPCSMASIEKSTEGQVMAKTSVEEGFEIEV